jgi:nicotinate-nucleotide adenylyltransferase
VYTRPGFLVKNDLGANLISIDAPLLQISSTEIRQMIKEKKSIRYLVPDKVKEEIERGGYYLK